MTSLLSQVAVPTIQAPSGSGSVSSLNVARGAFTDIGRNAESALDRLIEKERLQKEEARQAMLDQERLADKQYMLAQRQKAEEGSKKFGELVAKDMLTNKNVQELNTRYAQSMTPAELAALNTATEKAYARGDYTDARSMLTPETIQTIGADKVLAYNAAKEAVDRAEQDKKTKYLQGLEEWDRETAFKREMADRELNDRLKLLGIQHKNAIGMKRADGSGTPGMSKKDIESVVTVAGLTKSLEDAGVKIPVVQGADGKVYKIQDPKILEKLYLDEVGNQRSAIDSINKTLAGVQTESSYSKLRSNYLPKADVTSRTNSLVQEFPQASKEINARLLGLIDSDSNVRKDEFNRFYNEIKTKYGKPKTKR